MHQEPCIRCGGQGTIECDICEGKKTVEGKFGNRKCMACSGTGKKKCPAHCRGGVVWTTD
jgi:hypothetical protein